MSFVVAVPELMASATTDLAAIVSQVGAAGVAAAGPTTSLVAAAQDEVSAVAAQFFGAYGQEYQAILQQAYALNDQFVAALAAAGNAYTHIEASIASVLGLTGRAPAGSAVTAVSTAADHAVSQILFMDGSDFPNPRPNYIPAVFGLFMNNPNNTYVPDWNPLKPFMFALATAEGAYPFTGVKDLTFNTSLARGVTTLKTQIAQSFSAGATSLGIFGYSQSAQLVSLAMPELAHTYSSSELSFTLIGDPLAPNGGVFSRFQGLNMPSIGISFGGGTPSDLFPTTIYTREYDGFADFPRYPINVLADVNALAGIAAVHGKYPILTASEVATGVLLPGSQALGTPNSLTNYYMIPTTNLPLLEPIRTIPVIGTPIADLLQPDLTYLVNWGYGDPLYGYSTAPANVITPFGFLPPLSATTALGPLLVSGTQQGIGAFINDLASLPAVRFPQLPALTLPALPSIPTSLTGAIETIQTANTNLADTFATDVSTAYATLLPTADIVTAGAVSLPSYDVNLFLDGITEAINGNVIQGLTDAFGLPIAANVGLGILAAGFELIALNEAFFETIPFGTPNPYL
jgi:hypothetical protein